MIKKCLLEFWRVEGVDRKTGIREQRRTGNGKGKGPGLKPASSAGDGIAQAKAWAYLRNNGKAGVGENGLAGWM